MREENLMTKISNEFARKVSKNYDELVFSMLSRFGINKDNWQCHIDRIETVQTACTKHFFVDREYRFSIIKEPDEMIFDDSNSYYKISIVYKVKVYEDMKGMTV